IAATTVADADQVVAETRQGTIHVGGSRGAIGGQERIHDDYIARVTTAGVIIDSATAPQRRVLADGRAGKVQHPAFQNDAAAVVEGVVIGQGAGTDVCATTASDTTSESARVAGERGADDDEEITVLDGTAVGLRGIAAKDTVGDGQRGRGEDPVVNGAGVVAR